MVLCRLAAWQPRVADQHATTGKLFTGNYADAGHLAKRGSDSVLEDRAARHSLHAIGRRAGAGETGCAGGIKTMENKSQTRGLKPFVAGDPRINRAGRPKFFDQLRKLAIAIACEQVTLSNG